MERRGEEWMHPDRRPCYDRSMHPPCPAASTFRQLLNKVQAGLLRLSPQQKMQLAIDTNDFKLAIDLLVSGQLDIQAPLPPPSNIGPLPRPQTKITLLHEAASLGSFEMVELLLGHGATPSAKTSWNITPMHRAAIAGKAHVMALLQSHGASTSDLFPCLSRYVEDDPYTPNSVELLQNHAGLAYVGDEHTRYRAHRDGKWLDQETAPPSQGNASRPRL